MEYDANLKLEFDSRVMENLFSGKILSACSRKEIEGYLACIIEAAEPEGKGNSPLLSRSMLRNSVSACLLQLGIDNSMHAQYHELDYRHDIIARVKGGTLLIDIVPDIASVKSHCIFFQNTLTDYKGHRIFLLADIALGSTLSKSNPENHFLAENIKAVNAGIVFADAERAFFVPAEFM